MISGRSSGIRAGRGSSPLPAVTHSERASTVGLRNRSFTPSWTPNARRMRLISRVPSTEWPPRWKKWSSMVTDGSPRTAAKRPQSTSSCGVRGARPLVAWATWGAGRARRSTLPLVVRGISTRTTKADGTMYSGRAAATFPRSSATSILAPSVATR
ncbi:hypothetical protein EES39_39920 [Streptomyces sp. ADI92-24]|nr:hypothetical protein EES39_39920 [Streptomyces sp. ADI92-24]